MNHPNDKNPEIRTENTESDRNNANGPRGTDRRFGRKPVFTITFLGLAAALIFAATLLMIPSGLGYMNFGDGMILLCAYLFGPWVFFPAAIGSALSDLALGYTVYIPATFVIKGLLGLCAGLILRKSEPSVERKAFAFAVAETIMVGGYFLFEGLMYGFAVAAAQVPANLIQAVAAIAVASVLTVALRKFRSYALLPKG